MTLVDRATRLLAGRVGRRLFKRFTIDRASIFFLHRLENPQHGIRGHTADFIVQAIALLRDSGATFVSLRNVIEARAEGKRTNGSWVAFTMDDGFADQYELARNVFVKHSCPVTIFPVTGLLDRDLWPWDDQLAYAFRHAKRDRLDLQIGGRKVVMSLADTSQRNYALGEVREWCKRIDNKDLYEYVGDVADRVGCLLPSDAPAEFEPMSWSQARELEGLGVDFGVHTVTHRIVSRLEPSTAEWELRSSWERLTSELNSPLPVVAWPTGRIEDFSQRDETVARAMGLSAGVSTVGDYARVNSNEFTLSRFALPLAQSRILHYGSWIESGKQLLRRARWRDAGAL